MALGRNKDYTEEMKRLQFSSSKTNTQTTSFTREVAGKLLNRRRATMVVPGQKEIQWDREWEGSRLDGND